MCSYLFSSPQAEALVSCKSLSLNPHAFGYQGIRSTSSSISELSRMSSGVEQNNSITAAVKIFKKSTLLG